ncbi:MAG: hypothetical protein RL748_1118 [Pseudomonadota bacterium]
MNDALFEPAPDFDQPIAVLKHCHDKIRKQIKTLQRLIEHLPVHGASHEAQQAAQAVLQYFNKAARLHHLDEEQDLMPMLQACAHGDDALTLQDLVPKILKEHKKMEAAWPVLELQLSDIASGKAAQLSASYVNEFAEMYATHMVNEETMLAPMALRLFNPQQMQQLGQAMQQRRNAPPPAPPALDLSDLRQDYRQAELSEDDVLQDPIAQFITWFEMAQKAQVQEPNAMSLSTVGDNGRTSSRIVLIKQCDARGFSFFTNYQSRKGQEIAHQAGGALLFFWPELERQIRIEGHIERVDGDESTLYFNSRPLLSRLAAIASEQSEPIANRAAMEAKMAEVTAQYGEQPARPDKWGGYRLVPDYFEFWQGRRSRFHDRIVYRRQADGSWLRERLQP